MVEIEQVGYIIGEAFDSLKLELYIRESTNILKSKLKHFGVRVSGPIALKRRNFRFDTNRSPHVDKKSREQFEQRASKRLIVLYGLTPSVMQMLGDSSLFPPPPSGVETYLKIKKVKLSRNSR